MRWGAFSAALLAVFVVDTTIVKTFSGGILGSIDFFLIMALFYGFCAPAREAPLAGWLIGLTQDMTSLDALGVHATGLGLMVLGLTVVRDWANSDAWWVQAPLGFLVACGGGLVVAILSSANLRFWERVSPSLARGTWEGVKTAVMGAVVVTACLQVPWIVLRRKGAHGYRRRW